MTQTTPVLMLKGYQSSSSVAALNLSRYRFHFRVTEQLRLPEYAGSTLRGAFGHALRQLACVTKARECKGCALLETCSYPQVFSPHDIPRANSALRSLAQIPVPYAIEAPLTPARSYPPGDTIYFDMVLLGQALQHIVIIILAWRRAFLRGVGNGDGKAELLMVEQQTPAGWQSIYSDDQPVIREHSTRWALPEHHQAQDVHIHLVTPLRLQQKGKVLGPREINASIFLRNLIRRVAFQFELQGVTVWPLEQIRALNILTDQVQDDRRLVWREWGRFSSRQKQSMKLGGVVGRWYFKQVPAALLPFIDLGQWLHVGKEVSFGLGKYLWVDEPWQPGQQVNGVNADV